MIGMNAKRGSSVASSLDHLFATKVIKINHMRRPLCKPAIFVHATPKCRRADTVRGGMPLYHNADATYSAPCSDQYRWRCRAVVVDALHLYCFTRRSLLETIASYGTRFVVCDIRAWSFTGGTPFALSLNALRLPHAAKSSTMTCIACHCGAHRAVSTASYHPTLHKQKAPLLVSSGK